MTATSEMSAWYNESAAVASSSQARCSSPSLLPEASRAKLETRPAVLASSSGSHRPYPDVEHMADTHSDASSSSTLIHSPSHRHSPWPPTVQPSTTHLNFKVAALFPSQYTQQAQHSQNVLPPINPSFTNDYPETARQHGTSRSPPLELFPPSSTSTSNDDSINSSKWSSHPVFTNPTALAAHHGIPQSLPPVPRTTRYTTTENQAISSPSSNNDFDFSILRSNYLTMLSQKPAETIPGAHPASFGDDSVQAVLDLLIGDYTRYIDRSNAPDHFPRQRIASPEYQSLGHDFGAPEDYLTSPMDDSPWDEMLTTPALGTNDFLTSPAIVDSDDFGFGEVPLFGDSLGFEAALQSIKAVPPTLAVQHPLSFDGLYTMPSPETPSLDPSSLNSSVNVTPATANFATPSFKAPTRRKNPPTGTRKNITPEALVPYDAPIQSRKYITPSATSRKEVPAVFAKKRARSQAFGDDDEEDEDMPIDPNDVDAIEAKRRQNTLAARRSRKRKLEYQRELEASVDRANDEKNYWMDRAMVLENALRNHGIEVPPPSPAP